VIGQVCIAEEEGRVTQLLLGKDPVLPAAEQAETALLKEAFRQLAEYLSGERKAFDLPLAPAGTPYQRKVWQALLKIPYGATASYKEVAAQTGNAKAARAVGMANNRNPIPIFIPCHRVIGADGSLVGYGCGLDIKRRLLELEGWRGAV